MKKSIVIVLAVVLVALIGVAVILTVMENTGKNQPTTEPAQTTQPTQTENTEDQDTVPETTQKSVEVTVSDEGEGSPFDDVPAGEGPSIGLDLGDEEEPTPTTKPAQPQETKPQETKPQETKPQESKPQETKPQVGGDGEWDATIDFSELLKP